MVTGFEIDGQRIASQQVEATLQLAKAIQNLTIAIMNLTEVKTKKEKWN